jgi:DNA-binding response OmpR family regulator
MPSSPPILIVDDEPSVRDVFAVALAGAGYAVATCPDGQAALDYLRDRSVRLVLLDVDMPVLDGWATLAALRRQGFRPPVIVVSHICDPASRIRGLDTGADDYLGKPCGVPELLARVRAVLRRSEPTAPAPLLTVGDVTIDLAGHSATRAGVPVRLSRTDFALLSLLHEHAGAPVPRALILQRVWGGASGSSHALDTHIWRLRRKLGDDSPEPRCLRNVPGIGYALHPANHPAGPGGVEVGS